MHADVGTHGGTATGAVRRTGQLLAANAETRIRRRVHNTLQLRQRRDAGCDHVVELRPIHVAAGVGGMQRVHPAPAFQHHGVNVFLRIVVISRIVNLEEALRAAFLVDQRTVAFSEAGR
ncbi:hypothetical protein D3C81_368940 [compost metagenome]